MEGNKKFMIVGVLLAIAVVLTNGQSFCRMTKEGLKACKPSVTGKANAVDPPSSGCCSAISNADLQCLCHYKDSGWLSFYGVDPDQAMGLPVKCKLVDSFHC